MNKDMNKRPFSSRKRALVGFRRGLCGAPRGPRPGQRLYVALCPPSVNGTQPRPLLALPQHHRRKPAVAPLGR